MGGGGEFIVSIPVHTFVLNFCFFRVRNWIPYGLNSLKKHSLLHFGNKKWQKEMDLCWTLPFIRNGCTLGGQDDPLETFMAVRLYKLFYIFYLDKSSFFDEWFSLVKEYLYSVFLYVLSECQFRRHHHFFTAM